MQAATQQVLGQVALDVQDATVFCASAAAVDAVADGIARTVGVLLLVIDSPLHPGNKHILTFNGMRLLVVCRLFGCVKIMCFTYMRNYTCGQTTSVCIVEAWRPMPLIRRFVCWRR